MMHAKGQRMTPEEITPWLTQWNAVKRKYDSQAHLEEYFTASHIGDMAIEVLNIGDVNFPTGQIIACDPFIQLDSIEPFMQTIPVGKYPVQICVMHSQFGGQRYAAVKVAMSDTQPVRYELGVTGKEDLDDIPHDDVPEEDFFGFGVDAGMASIADLALQQKYNGYIDELKQRSGEKYFDEYDELFSDLLEENYEAHPHLQNTGGSWLNWTVPQTDLNIAICESGWGDGGYPTYFGYDAQGNVTGVYIKFIDIAQEDEAEKQQAEAREALKLKLQQRKEAEAAQTTTSQTVASQAMPFQTMSSQAFPAQISTGQTRSLPVDPDMNLHTYQDAGQVQNVTAAGESDTSEPEIRRGFLWYIGYSIGYVIGVFRGLFGLDK